MVLESFNFKQNASDTTYAVEYVPVCAASELTSFVQNAMTD